MLTGSMSRIPRVRLWVLAVTVCLAAYSNPVLPQEPSPFERAEAALRQGAYVDALKILRGIQNASSEVIRCDALIGLGQLYIALTELSKAKDYLEQARELADRLGTPVPAASLRGLFRCVAAFHCQRSGVLLRIQTRNRPGRLGAS